MLEDVKACQVAEEELDRNHYCDEGKPPVQHHARLGAVDVAQHIPGAGRRHAHAGRQECSEQHVRPADHHHRPKHDLGPVRRNDLAVDDRVAEGHLHPAVVGENPERREHRPERDHAAGEEIEARRHAVAREQHHAEERRLQHEGGESLVAEQRPLDRAGPLRQHPPVGAELERHHDARHHPHAERDREHLEPEVEHAPVERVARSEPRALDRRQPGSQPDREGREDDVEADEERELEPREENGIEIHLALPL